MPPITLHMVLARSVAAALGEEELRLEEPAYLLGSTTPDIRVITRQDRYSTHFFDLEGPDHQDSVQAFLEAHPELADPGALNPATRAFVAGYLTHLVFDEQYITQVYRRLFAAHERLGGTVRANLMDRLLQFDMERSAADPELRRTLARALGATIENIRIGFIEPETLDRWREVARDVAQRDMDWERVRAMIANHLRRAGIGEEAELLRFLDSLPALLDETMAYVSDEQVRAYLERSSEAAAATIARYLGCG